HYGGVPVQLRDQADIGAVVGQKALEPEGLRGFLCLGRRVVGELPLPHLERVLNGGATDEQRCRGHAESHEEESKLTCHDSIPFAVGHQAARPIAGCTRPAFRIGTAAAIAAAAMTPRTNAASAPRGGGPADMSSTSRASTPYPLPNTTPVTAP